MKNPKLYFALLMALVLGACSSDPIGIGAKAPAGAEILFDGSEASVHENWTYWEGPRFAGQLPIQWKIVDDPVDGGKVLNSDDPYVVDHKYGSADIVTKKPYQDFRLHVEFMIPNEGGNSGVYLQNRYEIQVLDGDSSQHGMATVINEVDSPYAYYNGTGKWNAYDIQFRAARFKDGEMVDNALVTNYFNGTKVYSNVAIKKVWGGANSGIDGGNEDGFGITDSPQGLKLQAEGHVVLYRNIWIRELDLEDADTNF